MRYVLLLLGIVTFTLAPAYAEDVATSATTPVAASVTASTPAAAPTFSDTQRAEIESIVQDYLVKQHPEIIMQAAQELQKRDQADADAKSKAALTSARDKIYNDPNTPIGGNPKGNVTVVEFYDYQCGYCKMSEPAIEQLLKDDKNVKLVYKNFPILGPMSTEAAKASFASIKQNKFQKFHDALIGKKEHLTDDIIYQTAKDSGLDVEKLKKDMNAEDVNKLVEANLELGGQLGVRGTPMFIIGDQVYPGALQYDQMKKAVDDARAAEKK